MAGRRKFSRTESYRRSLDLLKMCTTSHGFIASADQQGAYKRVWSRDGIICGLAALMTDDKKLIRGFRKTIDTLMAYQHKLGFMPSNVDPVHKKVSYGGSAGRVDATIWAVIAIGQYYKRTKDKKILKQYYHNIKKIMRVLDIWEFNDKDFIYVPMGGDWADEYINEGYILYDQLLYLQALREYADIRKELGKKNTKQLRKAKNFLELIEVNYYLLRKNSNSPLVYNKVVFEKGIRENLHKKDHLLPYFNPAGYGKRFDGFANVLAMLFDAVSSPVQEVITKHMVHTFTYKKTKQLVPAFWPVITRGADFSKLRDRYSVAFRNKPYEYHNGGLWPFINGFYAAAVAETNKTLAREVLDAVNWANARAKKKAHAWGFYEFINGETFNVGGMKHQAWSAAGGIIAYEAAINGKRVFL